MEVAVKISGKRLAITAAAVAIAFGGWYGVKSYNERKNAEAFLVMWNQQTSRYENPRSGAVPDADSLPERVVQLVMKPPPPPSPPPPPPPPAYYAHIDDLASLRDIDVDQSVKRRNKANDPGDVSIVQRSLITSTDAGPSGRISAPSSSGLAVGSGSLNRLRTSKVDDPKHAARNGKASRVADEIALAFTRNKGAIDAASSAFGCSSTALLLSSGSLRTATKTQFRCGLNTADVSYCLFIPSSQRISP